MLFLLSEILSLKEHPTEAIPQGLIIIIFVVITVIVTISMIIFIIIIIIIAKFYILIKYI